MANVEHSLLTGASLHEPKGVAAATASTVYVADGLGSGAWGTVGLASLASTAKAFEAQLYHVRETQTSGTNSTSTTTANTWVKRVLNTEVTDEITSSSLTSSVISLPAGTYYIEAESPQRTAAAAGLTARLRLRNTTASTTLVTGPSTTALPVGGAAGQGMLVLAGRFTLGATSNLELQIYAGATAGAAALAVDTGETEVYTDVRIWKVG